MKDVDIKCRKKKILRKTLIFYFYIKKAEKFIAKRKGELFKRVKPSTLLKLL